MDSICIRFGTGTKGFKRSDCSLYSFKKFRVGKNDDFFGQVQSLSIGDLTLTRPQSAAAVVQRRLNNSLHDGGGRGVRDHGSG